MTRPGIGQRLPAGHGFAVLRDGIGAAGSGDFRGGLYAVSLAALQGYVIGHIFRIAAVGTRVFCAGNVAVLGAGLLLQHMGDDNFGRPCLPIYGRQHGAIRTGNRQNAGH